MQIPSFTNNYIIIVFLIVLASCSSRDQEICEDCLNTEVAEIVSEQYFRYNKVPEVTLLNRDYHTSEIRTEYSVCNPELLESYNDKVLKISGFVSASCQAEGIDNITIEEFEAIDYCYDPIPESEEIFDIFNDWQFYSLETTDTIIFVPCEFIYTPSINLAEEKFEDGLSYWEGLEGLENYKHKYGYSNVMGNLKISNDSLFLLPGVFILPSPLVYTQATEYWDKESYNLISGSESLEEGIVIYQINKNILTLYNPVKLIKATLYASHVE